MKTHPAEDPKWFIKAAPKLPTYYGWSCPACGLIEKGYFSNEEAKTDRARHLASGCQWRCRAEAAYTLPSMPVSHLEPALV